MAQTRTLTEAEERSLTVTQKQYLLANPTFTCLEPNILAREALYRSLRHGAVTIDRAMELDELHAKYVAQTEQRTQTDQPVCPDEYSNAEDSFIDRNGMSSGLY